MRKRRRKTWMFWIALWCAVMAVGSMAHIAAWRIPAAVNSGGGFFGFRLLNVANAAMAPGDRVWMWITHSAAGGSVMAAMAVGAIGATFWTTLILVGAKVWRWARSRRPRGRRSFDASRRVFLVEGTVVGAGVVGGGAALNATLREPWRLRVVRHSIAIADLPAALEGLRLVQLSDTHLGPHVPMAFIQRAIDEAIALQPDLFLLTGDYVTRSARFIQPAATQLEALTKASHPSRPPLGVLGNHDWYANAAACRAAFADVGVRLIDNTRVFLDAPSRRIVDEPTAECICVAGVGDLWEDRIDAHHAFLNVPEATPRLVLSHQPDAAEFSDLSGVMPDGRRTRAPRVDLMISGHMHGGQVKLPLIGAPIVPSRFGQKYLGGVVQGPAFPVVVSRGIGMSVLPVRWGAPPEIVEITLRRKG